jgi:RNA polymerase-associated protein CTR9
MHNLLTRYKWLTSEEDSRLRVTVTYNIARLDDATGEPNKAREGYNKVLDMAPGYLDAKIRIAYINAALGEKGAEKQIEDLMVENPKNLEVRALYGWFLRRQRRQAGSRPGSADDGKEQKHYKQSLVEINKHDCYSLVALGNIYLAIAREIRVAKNADAERKDKSYSKAAELFDKALHLDPRNAFAAQGIAIIFAETKMPELAMHFFGKIRETLDDISVHVNSGHCLLELRQFAKAIEAYEFALNNFRGGHDLQLMTLLGRAWYARGVSEKSISALRTSLEYTEKAYAQQRSNLALKFNVAFMQFQLAEYVRRAAPSERTQADIEVASKSLEHAIAAMKEIAKDKHPPYPPAELEQRALMGENTLRKQLERALVEQKEYDETAEAKMEQARRQREQARQVAEEEERRREEEHRVREEKLAEERKRLQEEATKWTEDLNARLAQEKEKPEKKTPKGSRKKSEQSERSGAATKSARGRKSALSDEFINDSDISSYNSDSSGNESDNHNSDASGDEGTSSPRKRKSNTPQVDETKSKKKRRGATRAVVDDDDEVDGGLFGEEDD